MANKKTKPQLNAHPQWTTPVIQNEILDIMSGVVFEQWFPNFF